MFRLFKFDAIICTVGFKFNIPIFFLFTLLVPSPPFPLFLLSFELEVLFLYFGVFVLFCFRIDLSPLLAY